ncbi:MAG: trigger factor [Acidimicrobiia bacterium]
MHTSVEPFEENKVKLSVTVPADDFETAVDAAFRKLAREVKIPGFRPGRAPRKLLEAQFGPDAAREQALRDAIPGYYADAVTSEDIDVIAQPEIEITAGEDDGDVEFSAVVEVRPTVTVSGYDELRVEMESPEPDDEAVDAQVDQLRERFAGLEESTTPLIDGDFASVDIQGSLDGEPIDDLSATDYLYEVGSGRVVPELDDELRGEKPGSVLEFTAELPETAAEHAGETVSFRVLVKETQRKNLPAADDEFASEAGEFDTIEELRDDIRERIGVYAVMQAQMALRDKVLEALAELVDIEPPEALVDEEVQRRLHDLAHRLEPQGVSLEQYLAVTGQEPKEFLEGAREGAGRAVLADLGLRSVVEQEQIEPTDEEIDAEIERLANQMDEKPEALRKDLDKRGVLGAVRSEVARGKALQFLVENTEVVDPDGNPLDLTVPEPDESADDESVDDESEDDTSSGGNGQEDTTA